MPIPPIPVTKYHWTPELEEQLHRIYAQTGHYRPALGAELTSFAKRLGWPSYAVRQKAHCLGLSTGNRRPWTREEIEFLSEHAGSRSLIFLQRSLRRSYASVACKIADLRLSQRVTAGYSKCDVAAVMGVSRKSVNQWIACGWIRLSPGTGRVSEEQMRRFIGAHPEEYSLKRVDETWMKGMLFPGTFGMHVFRRPPASAREEGVEMERRA